MMSIGLGLKDPPMSAVPGLALAAEQAGLSHLFSTELSVVQDVVTGRDPFLIAASALAATSRLSLGTGVVGTPFHAPRHLALSAATLNEQYPGRFVLGLGVAHRAFADHIGWAYPSSPMTHIREHLRDLARIREGLAFGQGFPVWLAALGDKMIETAAAHADGVILNWVGPEGVQRAVETADEPGLEVAILLRVGRRADLLEGATRYAEMFPNYRRHFERQGLRDPETVIARTCLDIADLAGSGELLEEFAEAGVDHLILYPADSDLALIHQVIEQAARWTGSDDHVDVRPKEGRAKDA